MELTTDILLVTRKGPFPVPLTERFWPKVDKNGPTMPHMQTPCWIWTGSRNRQGYGVIKVGNHYDGWRGQKAHRVSWFIATGSWPTLDMCHHCDNPSCVNPDHLFQGDASTNMKDAVRKGRIIVRYGEENPSHKLTASKVAEIRQRYGDGEKQTDLAKQYGVIQAHISRIVREKSWSNHATNY